MIVPHAKVQLVSIHAPAEGATDRLPNQETVNKGFNPRACGRRDIGQNEFFATFTRFNPRACGRRDEKV